MFRFQIFKIAAVAPNPKRLHVGCFHRGECPCYYARHSRGGLGCAFAAAKSAAWTDFLSSGLESNNYLLLSSKPLGCRFRLLTPTPKVMRLISAWQAKMTSTKSSRASPQMPRLLFSGFKVESRVRCCVLEISPCKDLTTAMTRFATTFKFGLNEVPAVKADLDSGLLAEGRLKVDPPDGILGRTR